MRRPRIARGCARSSGSTSRRSCSSAVSSATPCRANSAGRCGRGGRWPTLVKERLPATLELSFAAALLALVVGIPLGVYTALRRDTLARAPAARGIARRRQPADVPDRHPADPRLRRDAGLAAVVRPRRHRRLRLVDHRAADDDRAEGADPAVHHAVAVPDDADHAAGALGDARGAAHRLHQVRPRPRHSPTARSISATRSRTRWCR